MAEPERPTPAERVREHRARLRARGMRPVQMWVPDVRSPTFVASAHAQSAAVANSDAEEADQAFVDAISWDWAADETGTEATVGQGDARQPE